MQRLDFIALGPLLIVAVFAVAAMVLIAFKRRHTSTLALCVFGLFAALFNLPFAARCVPRVATPLLVIDGYTLFYMGLILASAIATLAFSYGYLSQMDDPPEEFYLLTLIATLGSMTLVASRHMGSFFLGLEILSVSLYALSAYTRSRNESIEAGLKYLVLAGVSASFLLFGAALIYAETGTMDFPSLGAVFQNGSAFSQSVYVMAGVGFVIVAIGFKLAAVPFHMWTPDVYQGAPAPVTAFVATASKGAVAAFLIRLFAPVDVGAVPGLYALFAVLAVASMVAGNVLALMQDNVKRLLAYSSIAHMGYLLTAFLAGGPDAPVFVAFYLTVYSISILGCFGVMTLLSEKDRDADTISDYKNLFYTRPWLAGVMTAMLLSLAGIPLTAGFIGKFFVVSASVKTGHWGLALTLALTSGAGLFYYLRLIVAMFVPAPSGENASLSITRGFRSPETLALTVLCMLLLWLGVTPSWFMNMINHMFL